MDLGTLLFQIQYAGIIKRYTTMNKENKGQIRWSLVLCGNMLEMKAVRRYLCVQKRKHAHACTYNPSHTHFTSRYTYTHAQMMVSHPVSRCGCMFLLTERM